MTRVCSVCSIDQPLDDFERRKNGAHGRSSRCKKCSALKVARYYWSHLATRRDAKRKPAMQRPPEFYERYRRAA